MAHNEQLEEIFNREILPTSWAWANPADVKKPDEEPERWRGIFRSKQWNDGLKGMIR